MTTSVTNTIGRTKFQELLEKARTLQDMRTKAAIAKLEEKVKHEEPTIIEFPAGVDHTDEARVDFIRDVALTEEAASDDKDTEARDELWSEAGGSDENVATEPSNISEGNSDSAEEIQRRLSELERVALDAAIRNDSGNSGSGKEYGVARSVQLNERQQQFRDTAVRGQDCVLIGAAGTGKTTSVRQTTQAILDSGRLPRMHSSTKWLQQGGVGACVIAYTNKATNNIRHAVIDEFKQHTITGHKLLEFAPNFYWIEDPETKELKKTMKFEPTRNSSNPLPSSLSMLVFEEGSMYPVELYGMTQDALPHPHQEIFIGDIQQLAPVFGMAILGFKMATLPVIELTEVYRQARESPILDLAWKILEGDKSVFDPTTEIRQELHPVTGKSIRRVYTPSLEKLSRIAYKENGEVLSQLVLQPWQKKIHQDYIIQPLLRQFFAWEESGYYDPFNDIILCPFNVGLGCDDINLRMANYLGKKRGALVHEVIAGYEKHYLAVGDRVMFNKEEALIIGISRNFDYTGKSPRAPSIHMDRMGHMEKAMTLEERTAALEEDFNISEEQLSQMIDSAADSIQERTNQASHDITIQFTYGDESELHLCKSSEVNDLAGGHALSVHKSQGSEWDRGFIVMHDSHATMNQRELLYTAVSRFKKFLHFILESDTLYKGVTSQKIKGTTWQEKVDVFKGKMDAGKKWLFDASIVEKHGGDYLESLSLSRIYNAAGTDGTVFGVPKRKKDERKVDPESVWEEDGGVLEVVTPSAENVSKLQVALQIRDKQQKLAELKARVIGMLRAGKGK